MSAVIELNLNVTYYEKLKILSYVGCINQSISRAENAWVQSKCGLSNEAQVIRMTQSTEDKAYKVKL